MKQFAAAALFALFLVSGYDKLAHTEDIPASLTLKQCIDCAKENSYELKIQSERITQARTRLKQAKGGILPDIRFKYTHLQRDTAGGVFTEQEDDSSFELSQPLFYGFRKTGSISFSKIDIGKEESLYKNACRLLGTDVIQSFYAVIQIRKDIENIQNTVTLMHARMQELSSRIQLGKSRESEALAVESQIATLLAQQEKAEGDREKALEDISRLIVINPSSIMLSDENSALEGPGTMESYLEAVKNRADIAAARQEAAAQSEKVKISRGSLLPSLNLDGSWYTGRNGSLSNSKWDTTVSLDVPLFQGGIARGKINEELSKQKELEHKLSLVTLNADAEIKKLYKSLAASLNQANALKDAYNKAEKSYQLQMRDYKLGLVNNLDVLQAMTLMSDAKRNLDRVLIQVKTDKALLENALQ